MRRALATVLIAVLAFAPPLVPAAPPASEIAYFVTARPHATAPSRLAQILETAGFEARPLPLDRSPDQLEPAPLIVLGSYASDRDEVADYLARHAQALRQYVGAGGVLLQMAQHAAREPVPPYLPVTHVALRTGGEMPVGARRQPEHSLLQGVDLGALAAASRSLGTGAFDDQGGFGVLLARATDGLPILMEGAHDMGRLLLSALDVDQDAQVEDGVTGAEALRDRDALAAALFANLHAYCADVATEQQPHVVVTPSRHEDTDHVPGSWTLAVLPDTQVYALRFPSIFMTQTNWLKLQRDILDIRYVLHVGDIVDDNTPAEWEVAQESMSVLDGVVPYALAPGNHDYGPGGDATTRDSLLDEYFSYEVAARQPGFGGAMEPGRLENTWHAFEAGGRRWIVLALEWGPRTKTIAWANRVMSEHPDAHGILITHSYLDSDDKRCSQDDHDHLDASNPHDYASPGGVNDGEELWQKLVRKHRFDLVLCGHVLGDGAGYLASKTDRGTTCHQILANYQMLDQGGGGYLRLFEFRPDGTTVQVKTWSPYYEHFLIEPDQHFSFQLDPIDDDQTTSRPTLER